MITLRTIAASALLALGLAGTASAATLLNNFSQPVVPTCVNNSNCFNINGFNNSGAFLQFTTGPTAATVESATFQIQSFGPSDVLAVEIYEVDSGDQLGATVGSLSFGSVTPGTVPGDPGTYDFVSYNGSIGLAANTNYWLGVTALADGVALLRTEGGGSEGEFSLTGKSGFQFTSGSDVRFFVNEDDDVIYADLQGSVAPIPLPASAFLLLGGLAFGAAATRRSKKS